MAPISLQMLKATFLFPLTSYQSFKYVDPHLQLFITTQASTAWAAIRGPSQCFSLTLGHFLCQLQGEID